MAPRPGVGATRWAERGRRAPGNPEDRVRHEDAPTLVIIITKQVPHDGPLGTGEHTRQNGPRGLCSRILGIRAARQDERLLVRDGPPPFTGFEVLQRGNARPLCETQPQEPAPSQTECQLPVIDAYTGPAGLPEEEYLRRLVPYPGMTILTEVVESL